MAKPPTPDSLQAPGSREARLAAKLRENLHRRKAQARLQDGADRGSDGAPEDDLAKPGGGG